MLLAHILNKLVLSFAVNTTLRKVFSFYMNTQSEYFVVYRLVSLSYEKVLLYYHCTYSLTRYIPCIPLQLQYSLSQLPYVFRSWSFLQNKFYYTAELTQAFEKVLCFLDRSCFLFCIKSRHQLASLLVSFRLHLHYEDSLLVVRLSTWKKNADKRQNITQKSLAVIQCNVNSQNEILVLGFCHCCFWDSFQNGTWHNYSLNSSAELICFVSGVTLFLSFSLQLEPG